MQTIIGNKEAVKYLEDALSAGELSHAYLFYGPDSVGKTTVALGLAQRLLCETGGKKDCICANCKLFTSGNHPDLHVLDGNTAGIDDVRSLTASLGLSTYQSRNKVAIISHTDSLSIPALNSFLKTLEEPTKDTTIVLTAERLENVLPTIVSRSRLVPFRAVTEKEISDFLCLEKSIKREYSDSIAEISAGRVGEAIRMSEAPELAANRIAEAREYLRVYRSESISDKIFLAMKLAAAKEDLAGRLVSYLIYFRKQLLGDKKGDLVLLVEAIEGLVRAHRLISRNISLKLVMETTLLGSINR